MGKNKKKQGRSTINGPAKLAADISGARKAAPQSKRDNYPLPFPSHLPVPQVAFLRSESPYRESFQTAIKTSYEGLAIDLPTQGVYPDEKIRSALQVMEHHGFFRTDVTQPFGLGTKCAKTYVTRCLLGERGNTYRYLGLRMFAFPWDAAAGYDSAESSKGMSLQHAIDTIRELNGSLTTRTEHHLSKLNHARAKRGAPPTRGRAGFDVTLINRMENFSSLKKETSVGEGRCSVSWHADSSLEHYSTIAVYHTIFSPPKKEPKGAEWSMALRVAHNSEGPLASRRGTDIESSIVKETPPVAVSLPSGSAYFLLDDFNHHHQHAVLATGGTGSAGVRFSSTHRLLRESHNVDYIIERCRTICSNFHKKGARVWRAEQLLLTEIETEWLRQFYIQGRAHKDYLWQWWREPIETLLRYWSQLENRTKQTIDLLRAAAGSNKCRGTDDAQLSTLSRKERKQREKGRKAENTLNELLERNSNESATKGRANALPELYDPLAALLEERATMRELWSQRECDPVFRDLGPDCAPIPLPVEFGVDAPAAQSKRGSAISPLLGTATDLRSLASDLRSLGKAFSTGDSKLLPTASQHSTLPDSAARARQDSDHAVPLDWEGWDYGTFGLEMQEPWAGLLLDGKKTVETRLYDLPAALLNRQMVLLESRPFRAGVSALGNVVDQGDAVRRAGWVKFTRVETYRTRERFQSDVARHCVTKESGYGWQDDKTKVVYGWVVGECGRYPETATLGTMGTWTRRMRSLFQLTVSDDRPVGDGLKRGTGKRKSRRESPKQKKSKKKR